MRAAMVPSYADAMLEKLCRGAAVGLTGGMLVLASCVSGDSAPVGGTAVPDGGSTPDTGTGSDASTADAGKCAVNTGECDGNPDTVCETDLRTTNEHCGACGRSCGTGATCQAGQCTAEALARGLPAPFSLQVAGPRLVWYEGTGAAIWGCRTADCGSSKAVMVDVRGTRYATEALTPRQIAVDAKNFYYAECGSECGLSKCDLAGCKLSGGTQLDTSRTATRISMLVVAGAGGAYTYHGLEGLTRVDLTTGAPSYAGSTYKVQDQFQALYTDGTDFVYVDPDASLANPIGGLFICPYTGCTGARNRLLPPPVRHLAAAARTAFTSSGPVATASIIGCAFGGCGGGGTVLAPNQPYVSDIAADETAVYWSTTGVANPVTNNAPLGTVMRCALPSCAGGPTKIAEGVVNPTSIALDKDYIYWLTRGGTTPSSGEIWRRRR